MENRWLAGIVLALFVGGCSGGDSPAGNAAQEDTARVKVEEVEYQELPGGARIVTGTVHNASSEPIAHVQIQLSLYDDTNTRVGSMIIPLQGLDPGEHQPFRSAVKSERDVRAVRPRSVLVQ